MDIQDYYKRILDKYNTFNTLISYDVPLRGSYSSTIFWNGSVISSVHGPEITDFISFITHLHELGHVFVRHHFPYNYHMEERGEVEVLAWSWALEVLKKEGMRLSYIGAYFIHVCLQGYLGKENVHIEFQNNDHKWRIKQLEECRYLLNRVWPKEE